MWLMSGGSTIVTLARRAIGTIVLFLATYEAQETEAIVENRDQAGLDNNDGVSLDGPMRRGQRAEEAQRVQNLVYWDLLLLTTLHYGLCGRGRGRAADRIPEMIDEQGNKGRQATAAEDATFFVTSALPIASDKAGSADATSVATDNTLLINLEQ
ncbi:hypothetical protein NUW58_g5683 [Xylaria curta]|uniref:Uncharacterized protein n=1 Tax=Xylaria curta TaxID=42375 RepID=A0ACC1P0Y5_9PEZI|nr:hypothetical protein NUW58_g5683 [Xylaria curta]